MATPSRPASKSRNGKPRRGTSKQRLITPEDLLRFVYVSDPSIAPDGSQILFTRKHYGDKYKEITNLWIVPTSGGEPRQFTSGEKDGHGRWSPDGSRIAFISGREKHHPNIFVLSAAGGEATQLTHFPEGKIGSFKWSPDGSQLAVLFRETEPEWTSTAKKAREDDGRSIPPRVIDEVYYRLDGDGYFGANRYALYVVDAKSGEHRKVFDRDTTNHITYSWSPDSAELVLSANTTPDGVLHSWKVDLFRVNAKSGKARKLTDVPAGVKSSVAWSPDGEWIAFAGRDGKETWGARNTHLHVHNLRTGENRNLTSETDYCLVAATLSDSAEVVFEANIKWAPDSKRVLAGFGWHGETHVASIPIDGGKPFFHTHGRKTVGFGNVSEDGRHFAAIVADPLKLPEVHVGRFSDSSKPAVLTPLTSFNQALLGELSLAEPTAHWIDNGHGGRVQTWVLKHPSLKRGKKYPAVLQIHGGPHSQYGESFFHEFQVLAAAGYIVVYSNPRGSKGYGEQHCDAIRGKWGAADWEDIQAVTAFMKKLPDVNHRRMGVMGGSYGGYMTNWVIGHTRDFAAAITDRCVSNLVSMVGSSDLPLVPGEYWDGNSWDNTEDIWEQSPLKHLGNATAPTLVIHSDGDLRCNVEQGEQVFTALKLRGIPTRFVRYPSTTSHGLSRSGPPDLRIHRLNQILDWWKKYLG